jgi:hypothetical protein
VSTFEFVRAVAAVLGVIATIVGSIAVIWGKAAGPWIAKPISRAIRRELTEAVEAIILSDLIQSHIRESTEESVAAELGQVMGVLHDHEQRLARIELNTEFVAARMAERPPRR